MVSSRDSLALLGQGASLALVGQPSSYDVTLKITYQVAVLLYQPVIDQLRLALGDAGGCCD